MMVSTPDETDSLVVVSDSDTSSQQRPHSRRISESRFYDGTPSPFQGMMRISSANSSKVHNVMFGPPAGYAQNNSSRFSASSSSPLSSSTSCSKPIEHHVEVVPESPPITKIAHTTHEPFRSFHCGSKDRFEGGSIGGSYVSSGNRSDSTVGSITKRNRNLSCQACRGRHRAHTCNKAREHVITAGGSGGRRGVSRGINVSGGRRHFESQSNRDGTVHDSAGDANTVLFSSQDPVIPESPVRTKDTLPADCELFGSIKNPFGAFTAFSSS